MGRVVIFLWLSFFLLTSSCSAQETEVSLVFDNVSVSESEISFNLKFENNSLKKAVFYKPVKSDLNSNIFRVELLNETKKETSTIFTETIEDVDSILLSCDNSVVLLQGESFTKFFSFRLNEFTPFLQSGSNYYLRVHLNYKGVNFSYLNCKAIVFSNNISTTNEKIIIP